jgi:3-hydroxyisobutyrate dehydrogenase-like beta-hydroxyacid dehydrogenase
VAKPRIGFVGVGSMGRPMALRLLDAGHDVVFASRRSETVQILEQAGARGVPTPLIVAEECDIFLTCLPGDSELNDVYLGPEGVLELLKPGTMIIDFTTASPMMIQRVAAEASHRDIRVIDAPVSGGSWGAERGTLTIMAGCDEQDLQRAEPILSVLGQRIFHVGGIGSGKLFKLINNLLAGTTMVMVGEALSLAANAGADLDKLFEVISASSGNSNIWSDSVPKMIHGDANPPGFKLELMRKDIRLAASLGEDLGTPVPLASLALQFYTAACARGMGKQAANDVARLVGRLAGADFRKREDGPDD